MHVYLLIALGGACGALSRYGIGRAVNIYLAQVHWPLGTFAVNIAGSFTIGALYVLITEKSTVAMLEAGKVALALLYMSATLASCVIGCWLGMNLAR